MLRDICDIERWIFDKVINNGVQSSEPNAGMIIIVQVFVFIRE